MKMPFSTGVHLKERASTHLSSMQRCFPSISYENYSKWHLIQSPVNTPLPCESFRRSSRPQTLHSHPHPPTINRACECVIRVLLDPPLIHWDDISQKPHSRLQAEPVPPPVAARTQRLFLMITELVNRNLTALGKFSRPQLISLFQTANARTQLNLYKYCGKIKRKIINVIEGTSPMPLQMPKILNLSSQCKYLVLFYFIQIKQSA